MHPLLAGIIFGTALLGNTALWIGVLNRSHGLGIWRPLIHCCTAISLVGLVIGPIAIAAAVLPLVPDAQRFLPDILAEYVGVARSPEYSLLLYAGVCGVYAVGAFVATLVWRYARRITAPQSSVQTKQLDLTKLQSAEGGWARGIGRLVAALPGNEIYRLDVNAKTLAIPRLSERLEGLSVAHLSDFHMSGRIGPGYFRQIVEQTNALAPDLVAITGDIVDSAACLGWIPETLGRLEAPLGVYFILGNHDRRVNLAELRRSLERAGLHDLGGKYRRLAVDDETILVAGNELPWIRPRRAFEAGDNERDRDADLRILLSHSPDQIRWAQRRGFDLMLAGHTHGGQIRLPLFGAVLAPSLYGTKYACGTFYEPPTLLHVTRGVSALTPLRWNCRPEIAILGLTASSIGQSPASAAREDEQAFATWT